MITSVTCAQSWWGEARVAVRNAAAHGRHEAARSNGQDTTYIAGLEPNERLKDFAHVVKVGVRGVLEALHELRH